MAAPRTSRLGWAMVASALCHGGILAALAGATLPLPPAPPSIHAVTLAFVPAPSPPAAQSAPQPKPAQSAPQPKPAVSPPPAQSNPAPKPAIRSSLRPLPVAKPAAPPPVAPAVAQSPMTAAPVAPAIETTPPVAAAAAMPAPPALPAPLPVVLRPDYLSPPTPPVYPAAARRLQIEGTVVIRALVERAGPPSEVTLWRSSGESLLDRSALDAVRGWRFRPMIRGGDSVAAWVEVPVTFSITNT